MKTAEQWIDELGLIAHPEGGYYCEVYRAGLEVNPEGFSGLRAACTQIYYLLEGAQTSSLHRILSDELWHFYAGSSLEVSIIHDDGKGESLVLSADQPFGWVPAGAWFGASLPVGGFALVGCTVAPGFDFADFEMGDRERLLERFPQHQALIERLTD